MAELDLKFEKKLFECLNYFLEVSFCKLSFCHEFKPLILSLFESGSPSSINLLFKENIRKIFWGYLLLPVWNAIVNMG